MIPAGALTSAGVGVGLARAGSLWRAGAQPPGRPLLPASLFKGLRRLRAAEQFPRLLLRPRGECSSFWAPLCEEAWGARARETRFPAAAVGRIGTTGPGPFGRELEGRGELSSLLTLADAVSFGSPNSKSCSRK